jgi:hypothetical protein
MFGEYDAVIQELMEIKDTGISIERLMNLKKSDFKIGGTFYLINPIYKSVRAKAPETIRRSHDSFVRNFFMTCVYYVIRIV